MFALIATALLAGTFTRTAPIIEHSQQAKTLALLHQLLPLAPSSMWVARRGDEVTAVALEAIAPDGYSGAIRLLLGIDAGGRVTGVRVTAHL